MSRMSELHDDLSTIHTILLGQRQVAQLAADKLNEPAQYGGDKLRGWIEATTRVQCIDDLLLEFEAAGLVWPGNVVELHA